jgi:hypothetical protein
VVFIGKRIFNFRVRRPCISWAVRSGPSEDNERDDSSVRFKVLWSQRAKGSDGSKPSDPCFAQISGALG